MAEHSLGSIPIRHLLAKRIVLATLFVTMVAFLVSSLIAWQQTRSSLNDSWNMKLDAVKKILSEQLDRGDFSALELTAAALATHPQVTQLEIAASFGDIVQIKGHSQAPTEQTYQRALLNGHGEPLGELSIHLSAFEPSLQHLSVLIGFTVCIVALCAGLSLWVYRILDNFLITPISRLHEHINRQDAHCWQRLSLQAPREIAELGRSLDRMANQLVYNANTDLLTGLPNRRHFLQLLKEHCQHTESNQKTLWVWFIDLDRFKYINDQMGHRAGDQVIEEIGQRLRQNDTAELQFARVGGDEFVGLLLSADAQQQVRITQWLLEVVCCPVHTQEHSINISFSIGIASNQAQKLAPQTLLHHADLALYSAKNNGRGCVSHYTESMEQASRVTTAITQALNTWNTGVEAYSYFVAQPIRHSDSLDLWGAEVLCRLPIYLNRLKETAPPQMVLSVAKELKIIDMITEESILAGIRWLKQNQNKSARPKACINLNQHQLMHPRLCPLVYKLLKAHDIAPQQLVFEITEDFYLEELKTREALSELEALGCAIALDDFGTGYSSLACLHSLPISIVKFDKSLLRLAQQSPQAATFFEDLTDLTRGQGKIVVAEGVETIQDLARVRKSGCHLGQGYFLGRPGQEATPIHTLAREPYAPVAPNRASGKKYGPS